jgi:uncharacterized protein (TIGR02231 family)
MQVAHKIEHVKLFLGKAQVTHQAEQELKPGRYRLVFAGLTKLAESSSIQVSGKGLGTIGGVQLIPDFLATTGQRNPYYTQLKDSIEYRKEQVAEWTDQVDVYQKEEAMLLSNQKLGSEEEGFDVEMLAEATNFFRTKLTEIRKQKREALKILKQNIDLLQQYQAQWGQDVEQNKQSQLDLVVDFTANGEGKCFFEFSYMTGGAGWEPSYDFRLNEQTKALTIIMKAVVKQESGKDWNRVLLILSDRVPSSNTQVPTLSTWNLDVNTPIRPLHKSKSLSRASRESVAYEGAPMLSEASDMASMEYTSSMTQRSYSTLSVEYQIADRLTIKGNGQEEIVSVIQYNLPITKKYLAIPKVQEEAFLLANITDWDTLNLLPGKASVYLDGSYTSDIRIDPSILSDTFPLLVGSDPGIVVNRSLVTAQTTVRTVGAQKRVMKTYSLGIRNKKKTPIEVIVKDQVPVSANSQISVDILELSGGTLNKETGEVEWKVLVPPMAQIEKRISFEIKFPKNQLVEGL